MVFLFKGYGDHRDLHSFPTRRSSDLVGMVRDVFRAELCPGAEAGGELAARPRLARDFARIGIVRIENEHAIFGQNAHQDRKSTRLNSSHSQISYAVF